MHYRYHYDPDTGLPHVYGHGVTEQEVEEVMRGSGDDSAGNEDSRIKIGKTAAGRYVQVVYVPDADRKGAFIITAYEPTPKSKKAFRRRKRSKRR